MEVWVQIRGWKGEKGCSVRRVNTKYVEYKKELKDGVVETVQREGGRAGVWSQSAYFTSKLLRLWLAALDD